jgi:hypothetical protein
MLGIGQPVRFDGGRLTVEFPYPFHAEFCGTDESQQLLAQVFEEVLGEPLRIACVVADAVEQTGPRADELTVEEADVAEAEQAAAEGSLPDDDKAHDLAVERLQADLGATVVESTD